MSSDAPKGGFLVPKIQIYVIKGNPVAQGRPRFARRGSFTTTYDPKPSKDYKRDVQMQLMAQKAKLSEFEAIRLYLVFVLDRPKSVKRDMPTCRPDLDNYIKGILDACNGILWADDSSIVEIQAKKRYIRPGEPAGVLIEISEFKP